MKKYNLTMVLLVSLVFIACNNDDDAPIMTDDQSNDPPIEELQDASLQILSNGTTRTWRITEAQLVNDNGTFTITNNFNIQDDDFVFDTNGGVTWKQGYDINAEATSAIDAGLDYYLAPLESTLDFEPDSSTELTGLNGRLRLTVVDNNTLNASITFEGRMPGGTLNIVLGERTQSSYPQPPSNNTLNFSLVTSNTTAGILFSEAAAGMIGSYSDNSLFLVERDGNQNNGERILKYNIDTQAWSENIFDQQQFVTKRLNIINNQLVVFGGQYANTYPLDPNGPPANSFQHDLFLTRFGFAVQNDLGYIVGNSDNWDQPAQIRSFNYLTNEIQTVTTLPKARVYGGAEIVDNKLYVFGGRPDFISEEVDAESFIVDLSNNQITSFNMPEAPTMSYAAKFQNLIYVGYETRTEAGDPGIQDDLRNIHFGVYNTLDNTFISLNDNLDDSNGLDSIHGITIFNGNLYVIYGNSTSEDFFIYSTPVN